MRRIKRIDFYKKYTNEDRIPTLFGACMSVLTLLIIFVLAGLELTNYLYPHVEHKVGLVKYPAGQQQNSVPLNFDVYFATVPCACTSTSPIVLQMMLTNSFGRMRLDPTSLNTVAIQRFNAQKLKLPANHISPAVSEKYKEVSPVNQLLLTQLLEREGCGLSGHIMVEKAPGSLHFFIDIRQYEFMQKVYSDTEMPKLTFTHQVGSVTVGNLADQKEMIRLFGSKSATEFNRARDIPLQNDVNFCLYYFPLVPHIFSIGKERLNKEMYQYSVTYNCQNEPVSIASYQITFAYSIKPVGIYYSEEEYSILQMLTAVTAIVTGVYVIMGMVKSSIDNFL